MSNSTMLEGENKVKLVSLFGAHSQPWTASQSSLGAISCMHSHELSLFWVMVLYAACFTAGNRNLSGASCPCWVPGKPDGNWAGVPWLGMQMKFWPVLTLWWYLWGSCPCDFVFTVLAWLVKLMNGNVIGSRHWKVLTVVALKLMM